MLHTRCLLIGQAANSVVDSGVGSVADSGVGRGFSSGVGRGVDVLRGAIVVY